MQINGRLHLDIKIDDKEYKINGNIILKDSQVDVEQEAEIIAKRIIEKVRNNSQPKTENIFVQKVYTSASQSNQTEINMIKQTEQINSRQETLKNECIKNPLQNCNSSDKKQNYKFGIGELQLSQNKIYNAITTPQKRQLRSTQSQTSIKKEKQIQIQTKEFIDQPQKFFSSKKSIQMAESQYFIEPKQEKKDGQHILQMIDNVHNIVRKNSSILSKISIQSPQKQDSNVKSQVSIKSSQTSTNQKSKKEQVVTNLLHHLKNTKKLADEFKKNYF